MGLKSLWKFITDKDYRDFIIIKRYCDKLAKLDDTDLLFALANIDMGRIFKIVGGLEEYYDKYVRKV